MKSRVLTPLVVGLLLLCQTALAAESHERKVTRTYDPGSIERLRVENLAGHVVFEGGEGGGLEIEATVHARDWRKMTAREISDLLEVAIEEDGGRLTLICRYPVGEYRNYHYSPGDGSFFGGSSTVRYDGKKVKVSSGRKRKGLPLWVDIRVRVPAGVACDLRNVVGRVNLDGVASDCQVHMASADFEARDQRGDLFVDSGSGDVGVEGMAGELRVDTGSGDVLLKGVDYPRLHVDTGSGDVDVISPGGEVTYWELDTGSGDVTLVLPSGKASFRLDVDTGSGDVSCDLPTKDVKLRHGEIRSLTVGGGSGRIIVDTGSGDVSIEKG